MEKLFNNINKNDMRYNLVFFLLLVFSVTSCSQSDGKEQAINEELSNSIIKRVTKNEFNSFLESNPEVMMIDVRTENEYNAGTIKDAINIDVLESSFVNEVDKLDKTKPILIFCKSGGRSSKALQQMKKLGFTHVLELEGGYSNY